MISWTHQFHKMFISKTSSFSKLFLKYYITNRILIERPFQWCKSHSSIPSGLATVGKRRHGCMSKNSFWLHEYRGVGVDGICENHSDFLYLFTVPYFHHIMVDPRSAWRFIEVMDIWPPLPPTLPPITAPAQPHATDAGSCIRPCFRCVLASL